ncbi:5'-nucleotidase, C-terminal domain [Carpediemonas membranifera]|uniref:5'-nucleotidase, C-terminal domain n=1 Tax=Carpediemonas membranifera TaxID=201153 RepID=A0A8J6AVZ6_9EUKA|nr:5'-nucleotidase, C-terminal domain [Carpediemonas membranifera]|eukprot:KAG9389613.1 5'-nucleotidase, C-terminal domain [Carpediemonas membranifera]
MKLLLVTLLLICVLGAPMSGTLRIWQTSDIHGWVDAHPHQHMTEGLADFLGLVETEKGMIDDDEATEFLLLDSGDQVQGTGFSDATDIDGSFIFAMMKHLPYDGMTVGNHELGLPDTVKMLHDHASDLFTESDLYVTTNTIWGSNKGESQEDMKPLGQTRYRTMTLKKFDMKVIIFGWIYNFDHDIADAYVADAVETINSDWFKAVIEKEKPDFVINLNHIATSDPQNNNIYLAQRALMPDTPLLLLTGHSHQFRHANCIAADGSTDPQCFMSEPMCYLYMFVEMDLHFTRASGKWQWADLPSHKSVSAYTSSFTRAVGGAEFETQQSKAMQAEVDQMNRELRLDHVLGCSDKKYSRTTAPYGPDKESSFLYFFFKVMEKIVYVTPAPATPTVSLLNRGLLRANMYAGQVTTGDLYTIIPFPDDFYLLTLTGAELKMLLDLNYHPDPAQPVERESRVDELAFSANYAELPHYMLSISPKDIDVAQQYNVVCTKYDSAVFVHHLNLVGPSKPGYAVVLYQHKIDPQDALKEYLVQYMTC